MRRTASFDRNLAVAGVGMLGALVLCGAALSQTPAALIAREQMVVAANPHATQAGLRMLRDGGSAVDAAIAVQLVLSLVEPQSSGIGGGAFMLHYAPAADGDAKARITAFAGRETAPMAATSSLFLDDDGRARAFPEVAWGGLAVGVPGVMRMLEMAHREHGRLAWSELFVPAIELAESGFEISPRLYFLLDRFKGLARAKAFREHYFDIDGEAHEVGHRLVNREYAATLRSLAARGAEAMYQGPLAEAIVATVQKNAVEPGLLQLEDLQHYAPERSEPLCSPYRQWKICGPQLPSSGGITVQQIMGIASSFALSELDRVAAIHVLSEASRLAFADRSLYLADPDFVSVPVAELLAPGYLNSRAALIDPERAMPTPAAGNPRPAVAWNYVPEPPNDISSTSHLSVTDRWGNAVAMTTSVQSAFGSQLMVGGFLLNNQLTDFSYEPERNGRPIANRPQGGKRPLSSMAPTFVLDDQERLRMIIGSPGGTRIIGYVAQVLVGVIDFGLDIQQAVAEPHFLAQFGQIELEERTSIIDYISDLEALGHTVRPRNLNSGLHGIVIEYTDNGRILHGGADPRREGVAAGD